MSSLSHWQLPEPYSAKDAAYFAQLDIDAMEEVELERKTSEIFEKIMENLKEDSSADPDDFLSDVSDYLTAGDGANYWRFLQAAIKGEQSEHLKDAVRAVLEARAAIVLAAESEDAKLHNQLQRRGL